MCCTAVQNQPRLRERERLRLLDVAALASRTLEAARLAEAAVQVRTSASSRLIERLFKIFAIRIVLSIGTVLRWPIHCSERFARETQISQRVVTNGSCLVHSLQRPIGRIINLTYKLNKNLNQNAHNNMKYKVT
jgi:hypothetical protein